MATEGAESGVDPRTRAEVEDAERMFDAWLEFMRQGAPLVPPTATWFLSFARVNSALMGFIEHTFVSGYLACASGHQEGGVDGDSSEGGATRERD